MKKNIYIFLMNEQMSACKEGVRARKRWLLTKFAIVEYLFLLLNVFYFLYVRIKYFEININVTKTSTFYYYAFAECCDMFTLFR